MVSKLLCMICGIQHNGSFIQTLVNACWESRILNRDTKELCAVGHLNFTTVVCKPVSI